MRWPVCLTLLRFSLTYLWRHYNAMTHRSIDTNTQIVKYRSLNCNRQVNMVFANVSSSRFYYLFIFVAELKGPYSVFNFEGYKISFRESLMSLIFPWFSLSRGNHTNLNCISVSEILLKEIILDMKQKNFFQKCKCL